mgnify:FL=1
MTFKYNNAYIKDAATVAGPYEKKGPLRQYFDKTYDDLYFGEDSWEKAEIKLVRDSLDILLRKVSFTKNDVDLVIGGDLLNQISASTYGANGYGKSFIGIYGACSSSVLGMIIGSNFVDDKRVSNAIVTISSHNMSSEKQFRNPTEYGAPKPKSATFTATGSASVMITNEKNNIRIESATLGRIIDYEQNDPNDMGRVMAPAAIDTLKRHLDDLGRKADYYDLILTGDLGRYGKDILKDYMAVNYDMELNNYDDCGAMLYDYENQEEVLAGGSGPVCSALVNFGYIFNQMRTKKLKRVLLIATGALFSPTLLYQKQNINSIAHAISLEVL